MKKKFQRVREIWKGGAAACDFPSVEAQITSDKLPEDVMQINLTVTLDDTVGHPPEPIRSSGSSRIMHRVGLYTQEDGLFKQNRKRVNVQLEWQHYPLGHESVALVSFARIKRKPHPHSVGSATQPKRLRQVRLAGATGARIRHPQNLHTRSQHRRSGVRRLVIPLGGVRLYMSGFTLDQQHPTANVQQNILRPPIVLSSANQRALVRDTTSFGHYMKNCE